jgi:hypothetical protein
LSGFLDGLRALEHIGLLAVARGEHPILVREQQRPVLGHLRQLGLDLGRDDDPADDLGAPLERERQRDRGRGLGRLALEQRHDGLIDLDRQLIERVARHDGRDLHERRDGDAVTVGNGGSFVTGDDDGIHARGLRGFVVLRLRPFLRPTALLSTARAGV